MNPEQRERAGALVKRIDEESEPPIRTQPLKEMRELIEQPEAAEQRWLAEQGWPLANKA